MYGYGYRYNSGLVVGSGGGGGGFVNTYSTLFDGVDDYLDVTNSFDFSGDFTLSAWVYPTSFGTYNMIFSWAVAGTDSYIAFRSGGRLYYYDGSFVIGTDFGFASLNTWQNIVVRREGTTITFFNNTTKFESPFPSTGKDNSGTLSIGRWAQSSLYLFNGNIDEVSVFDSALSDSEISDIYNSGNPTDLTSLSPVGWYRMGDNGAYKSPQWLIPSNENKDKVSNYSFELDGIDDYVNIPNNTELNFSSAYSVSFWIKTTSSALLSPISNQSKFLIRLYAPVNQIRLQLYDGSNGFLNLDNTQVFNDGNWHHIAFTTEATTTTDKVIVYFDGVALANKGTQLNIGSHLSAFPYEIGRNSGTWNFNGGIDEVSLYDSELSASQINDIYNGGEPTTISGAVAHYKMGEEANFTSNWLVDNSALDNYSKRSFEFDGVDDKVDCGTIPHFTTSQTTFSVSFWFKNTTVGGNAINIGGKIYFVMASNRIECWNLGNVNGRADTTAIIFGNSWHNLTYIFDGSGATNEDRVKVYLDGVLNSVIYQNTQPTSTTATSVSTFIGASPFGAYYNGNADEVAIFDSAISIADVWNGSGQPIDVSAVSGIVSNYRMGEDASFNGTNWTVPDNVGSNNGTSANMTVDDLVGEAPNYSGGGISSGMTIEDRVGNAPNSENNALSFNMDLVDRTTNVPT